MSLTAETTRTASQGKISLSPSFQLCRYILLGQNMPLGSREKAFYVSQFITPIGAGDKKIEQKSLYWWNQWLGWVSLPVPAPHSSERPWQWPPESPWVCVR